MTRILNQSIHFFAPPQIKIELMAARNLDQLHQCFCPMGHMSWKVTNYDRHLKKTIQWWTDYNYNNEAEDTTQNDSMYNNEFYSWKNCVI